MVHTSVPVGLTRQIYRTKKCCILPSPQSTAPRLTFESIEETNPSAATHYHAIMKVLKKIKSQNLLSMNVVVYVVVIVKNKTKKKRNSRSAHKTIQINIFLGR